MTFEEFKALPVDKKISIYNKYRLSPSSKDYYAPSFVFRNSPVYAHWAELLKQGGWRTWPDCYNKNDEFVFVTLNKDNFSSFNNFDAFFDVPDCGSDFSKFLKGIKR